MRTGQLSKSLIASSIAALGCCCMTVNAQDAAEAMVVASAQTQATASRETNAAVLVRGAKASHIVASAGLGGLEVYDLSGKRLGTTAAGEVADVDVAYQVPLGNGKATVLAAIDTTSNSLRLFSMKGASLSEVGARPLPLGFAVEGLCLYRNPLDSALYAFVVGDGGEVDQQILFATGNGKLDARQVRRINVPSPLKQCVADERGHLYASEEEVGIWRFNADPEAEVAATVIDAPRLGQLGKEVSGVAVYDGGEGSRWLIASNAADGYLNVYDRENKDAYLGRVQISGSAGGQVIGEPGLLFASGQALGKSYPNGVLLVTDEASHNTQLVSISQLASALKLKPGNGASAVVADSKVAAVMATVETTPANSYGDAADDPAIWANPVDPAKSLVIATDKKAGMYVYDMQGKVLQFLADGKVNNVDLREDFDLGGEKVVLVTASNRTHKTIAIYRLDTQAGKLIDVTDGQQPTGFDDPYGLCMYRNAAGKTYVFVNGDDTGKRQWELIAGGNGKVRAQPVRDMSFDSQTEGCVADDASGMLYVDEEDVALWKLSAEADGGNDKLAVQRVDANPAIKDDLEGLGIYDLGNGRGYIVVSSQGNDTYAVYRREGDQAYLGSFAVVANPALGIDGISETDGLEVSSHNLGPGFEHGAMVAQDGRNVMPTENQNYKYVSWDVIAKALNLEVRK